MPRVYLHIHDAGEFIEDVEGYDFPTLDLARTEAVAAIRELLAEKVKLGKEIDGQSIKIVDETEATVAVVLFRDQLRFRQDFGKSKTDVFII